MAKINISEEERERRRENMRRLHAEGKAGAKFGQLGGRPRKKRATEIAAERIDEDGERIYQELRTLIFEEENPKIKLDAIKHAHAISEQERKIEVEEEVRYDQLKNNELLEIVVNQFAELVGDGRLRLEDFIEGEIIEDPTRPAIGPGEID